MKEEFLSALDAQIRELRQTFIVGGRVTPVAHFEKGLYLGQVNARRALGRVHKPDSMRKKIQMLSQKAENGISGCQRELRKENSDYELSLTAEAMHKWRGQKIAYLMALGLLSELTNR